MIIRVFKKTENGPEFVKEIEVKGRTDDKHFMQLIDLNLRQVAKTLLEVDNIYSSGFKSIGTCGDFWSSFRTREGVAEATRNFGTSLMGKTLISATPDNPGEVSVDWKGKPVEIKTEEGRVESTELHLGVDVFNPGYVIRSSASVTNILGCSRPAYFDKITSKNFKQTGKAYARLFKDEKALLKYLKEKKDIFSYIHSSTGHEFTYETASDLWVHSPKEAVIAELEEVLDEINCYEEASSQPVKYGENAHDEACLRMSMMDIWKPVQRDFLRSDKIYMSEFGGVIYDLNEEAKEAVRRTSEYGLPYHVVRSNHPEIGDMYSVLFVSNSREDWETERMDKKSGYIFANVYNASMGIDEMGTIGVKSANGGLIRTA